MIWTEIALLASGNSTASTLLAKRVTGLSTVAAFIELAKAGHFAAAAKFNVIAAREIVLPVELPPGNIHVHPADAIMIVRGHFLELRDNSPTATAHGIR